MIDDDGAIAMLNMKMTFKTVSCAFDRRQCQRWVNPMTAPECCRWVLPYDLRIACLRHDQASLWLNGLPLSSNYSAPGRSVLKFEDFILISAIIYISTVLFTLYVIYKVRQNP